MRACLRFYYIGRVIGLAAMIVLASLTKVGAQVVDLRSDLCSPIVVGNDDLLRTMRIPVADDAFLHGDYRLAFHAYYQYFFCFNGDIESYNPAADDSGAAQALRKAVSNAYDGKYSDALGLAERSYNTDDRFGEAFLITGDLQWILRRQRAAVSSLSATKYVIGYATPPDHPSATPRYVSSAAFIAKKLKQRIGSVHHLSGRGPK